MTSPVLYVDCVGGVAGDMLLAALIDSGLDRARLSTLGKRLGFDDVSIAVESGRSGGFCCTRVNVAFDETQHPHARHLSDVLAIIEAGALSTEVKTRARAVFERLAAAEAAVHGSTREEVHFHEVGAVDAIVDIVGVCELLEQRGFPRVVFGSLPMGHGFVQTAHGRLPLPVPAVAEMLIGLHIHDATIEGETVTPTGLALLATLGEQQPGMPRMQVRASGTGAGTREQPRLPNIVRVFYGNPLAQPGRAGGEVYELSCTIDDCEPRVLAFALERCLAAGAFDAYVNPVVMKRGRPGHVVRVLVRGDQVEAMASILFAETTTLGVRFAPVQRQVLGRRDQTVQTPFGPVSVKLALDGDTVLRANPELSDCQRLAEQHGVPLQTVIAAARAAYDRVDQR